MRKVLLRLLSACALTALFLQLMNPFAARGFYAVRPAVAQTTPCQKGRQERGALYRICLPPGEWNGDLVVYAHGYVPENAPLALPGEADSLSTPLRELGYAFATTSYRTNGLAVLPAQEDLLDLVRLFTEAHERPRRVYLIGFSEGGLITTLSVEQNPDLYSGGLAMCGPVGDFQEQVNYFGDFRVVFDAYFPGLLPGSPVDVPDAMEDQWSSLYSQKLLPAMTDPANRERLEQLFQVTGAPYEPGRPETMLFTLRGALGYNAFATNDASRQLGGQPYGNQQRVYRGSADDRWLNETVRRFQPDPAALEALKAYQASGELRVPLVTLHTTGDEIVPFFHQQRYEQKVSAAGRGELYQGIAVERYGHCNFRSEEVLDAFQRLVQMVDETPQRPIDPPAAQATPTPPVTAAQAVEPSPTPAPSITAAPPGENAAPEPEPAPQSPWQALRSFFKRLFEYF